MDDFGGGEGFDRLMRSLEQLGTEGTQLPVQNVGMILGAAKERGYSFEAAWSMAINRLQPSQSGGFTDATLADALREDRLLIEEDRPLFQAAYEGREPTPRERATRIAAAWRRVDLVPARPAARQRAAGAAGAGPRSRLA